MLFNDIFDRRGLDELVEIFAELPDVFIYTTAVREAPCYRKFRISRGYYDRISENLTAPVPDGSQLADSAGQEYKLWLLA